MTEIGNDNLNSGVTTYNKSESGKLRRVWQNVALQSIFKKMEENKQVSIDDIHSLIQRDIFL